MLILFLCHTLGENSRQSTEWILSVMCAIPAASNLAHVPSEDRDCVGGWHCPLPFQGIGKASCEWIRTRLSCLLCLPSRLLWCMWMEMRCTAHKALFSYSSGLKHHGTMFSQRSRFPDPLTCVWHSESSTQTDYDSHIWHRYSSSCCIVCGWIVPWIIVASIWKWKEFSLRLCPWDCGSFGS